MVKILVVDNDSGLVTGVTYLLKRKGYTEIACAYSIEEAEKKIASFEPDLLILDYRMAHEGYDDETGWILAKSLPDSTLVVMFAADEKPRWIQLPPNIRWVSKMFDGPRRLIETVEELTLVE